jgi:hypothetical protein
MTTAIQAKVAENRFLTLLISLVFILLPFQRRFHGCFDSWSRRIPLPDFPLPDFFSKKIHLFITDPLILLLTLVLFFRYKVSARSFFWEGPSKYLTLLFFTALISLYFSITNHYALQYLRLLQFSFVFLFFNALCQAGKTMNLVQLVPILASILVTLSCFESAVGIYQYFTQHSAGLHFLGEIDVRHFPFHNPGRHRWLFDTMLPQEELFRATGTFSNPNILGGFLFCSVFASFYLFMKQEKTLPKIALTSIVFLQIFALYTAFSRSALLALIFAILLWGFLQIKANSFRKLMFLASSLLVFGIICIALFYSQLTARGGIINYNAVTTYADSERVQYLKMAIDMIKEHPLLGIGFNNFQLYENPIQPGYPGHIFFSKVHNIYLLIASEIGLIGGALFLLFILAILKKSWGSLSQGGHLQEKIFLFSVFCGLLFIGACDFYLLHTPHGRILFFGFAALLYSIMERENLLCKNND